MNSRYVSMAGHLLAPLAWAERAALCDGIRSGDHATFERVRSTLNINDINDPDGYEINGVATVLASFRYKVD